jgi:DNA-binding CsgD family transcriptional regulator
MQWLSFTDVEQIVHLVSCAADPTVEIAVPERKRLLLEGVAKLVSADIWYWSTTFFNASLPGDNMVTSLVHGGWKSEQEPAKFLGALMNPEFRPLIAKLYESCRDRHVTLSREYFPLAEAQSAFVAVMQHAGIGNFLVSFYPLGGNGSSGIGFYRRLGNSSFTDRERAIVHVVVSQVDWLHRHGEAVPAKGKVLGLSPRQRQVMAFLLGGDSIKEVSGRLELSEHTVGDYVKQIYRHFSVNSRAELLAHFISGGQT